MVPWSSSDTGVKIEEVKLVLMSARGYQFSSFINKRTEFKSRVEFKVFKCRHTSPILTPVSPELQANMLVYCFYTGSLYRYLVIPSTHSVAWWLLWGLKLLIAATCVAVLFIWLNYFTSSVSTCLQHWFHQPLHIMPPHLIKRVFPRIWRDYMKLSLVGLAPLSWWLVISSRLSMYSVLSTTYTWH